MDNLTNPWPCTLLVLLFIKVEVYRSTCNGHGISEVSDYSIV